MSSTRVNREEFLQQLESVQPGLSPREIVEQSSCFVFKDGQVITYNDEIACSHATNIKLEGAVQAAPLISLLRKLKEEELDIEQTDTELVITGKKKDTTIRMDKDVQLPIDTIEKPEKWKKLPDDFCDAINIVQQCAGKDQSSFNTTCIHIHPEWLEATDSYQITRYNIATRVKAPTLVRRDSVKHIVALGMIKISETETWMHFKNSLGLVLSCRRFVEDYPDLSPFLKVTGEPTVLPKGLAEAAERCGIFSSENADSDLVLVTLKPGKLTMVGQGSSGKHRERPTNIKYKGKPISFKIAPKLLAEITMRHNECQITEGALKVDGGKFIYVTYLGAKDE